MAIAVPKGKWPNHWPEKTVMTTNPRKSIRTKPIVFHKFQIGDVEDPWVYCAAPIYEWQTTEKGKWCAENCEGEMYLTSHADPVTYGYGFAIHGQLSDKNLTYYRLRWPD